MSIILDVILLAVLAAFIFTAAKKGFMSTLLELLAVIVALVLAYQLSPVVAQATYDGIVEKKIIEEVQTKIDETVDISATAQQTKVIVEAIPEFMVKYAASVGVDTDEIKSKISEEKITSENLATDLTRRIAQPIVVGALSIVFFFILSTALLFALRWLAQLLTKLFKIPLVKNVNQILGGVLGACKGIMVIIFISTMLELIFSGADGVVAKAVDDSFVVGLLDNINPFVKSLKEIF